MKPMNCKTKLGLILLVLGLAAAPQAPASVTLQVGMANIYEADGLTLANGIATYIVDRDGDGIGDLTMATTFLPDPDDLIIGKELIIDGEVGTTLAPFELTGTLNAGDKIWMVWYPGLTLAATAPGENQPYGVFRTDDTPMYSDIPFVVPLDGTWNLFAYTINALGELNENTFVANLMTVPEPSSAMLVVLGLLGFRGIARRRRVA